MGNAALDKICELQETIAALRADLARVTQERGAFYEVATQRMHDCNRLEKERDGARARAAFYEEERDGARARAERAEADAAAMREALEAARPWVSIHGGDDGASAAMPAGAGCNVGARIDAALATSAGTWLLAQLAAHRAFVSAYNEWFELRSDETENEVRRCWMKLRAVEAGAKVTKEEGQHG